MNIKHIFGLLCLTTGLCLFQACSDVPAPYDIPTGDANGIYGTGTLETPYTVRGAALNQNGGLAWVKAYIVGYIPQSTGDDGPSYTISDVMFSTDGAPATNIVIADNPNEKDINNCMAVQLPSGDVRSALNLADHPENIGKEIMLYGTMERYYGGSGVKSVTAAILDGQEIGDMPEEPAEAIFSADFSSSLSGFTSVATSGSLSWYNDYSSAMVTGFQDFNGDGQKENQAGVTYLVSPSIDLSQITEAYISINMAINFERADINTNNAVLISKNYTGDANSATWTQLTYNADGLNSSFTFREKEMNIPAELLGGSVTIALRHTCTETYSSTWEVKSLSVMAGKPDTGEDPNPDTPITGENLLSNGGFETWNNGEAAGWTPSNTACNTNVTQSSDAKAGSYSAMVEGSAEQNKRLGSSEMTLKAGTYAFTVNVKAVEAEASIRLGYAINEADGSISGGDSYIYGDYVNDITTDGWKEATYQFTLEADTRLNLVVMVGRNPGQSILIDEVSLVTSDGGITEGGDTPDEPEEQSTFTKVTTVTDGTYIFAANVGGTYMVAQNVSGNYGYLNVKEATATGNVISIAPEGMTFTLTSTADGYTIQDESGRFMYMTGNFNSCNMDAAPTSGQYWNIERNADGSFTITNIEMGKWMQFSEEYNSYGIYPDERGIAPCLFKMD